ncbi:hypothetical protein U9M48_041222 [Paspalum notatum var. saurae]|uniref:Disease resistance protein At4g27190-like leucine-rich repeats domain-containing protein n=1 Tax=Paspalum notatum var. saurae TaxID=547442 RepID=A0AAQ3UNB0_PASNO
MQRKIAGQLKLDQKTTDMFEERDGEDDFNGVDHGSRDVIWEVSERIDQTLRESRCMVVFLNGSYDEIDLREFGISSGYHCLVIWTFSRRFMTIHGYNVEEINKVWENFRLTNLFLHTWELPIDLSDSQLNALFREEAASIVARYPFMWDMDLTMVIECWCYGFFLRRGSLHSTIGLDWAAHVPNFWMCDGIIQEGGRAREICNALHSTLSYEGDVPQLVKVFAWMMNSLKTSALVVEDKDGDQSIYTWPCRWIFITSKNNIVQDKMQTVFFISPPFLHCHTLRFLGLSNCTNQNDTTEHEGGDYVSKWTFLHRLWVIDLRYTNWAEILSEEKIGLIANLTELNVEGVTCWQYTSQLQKRLLNLQKLRIIKTPKHETSMYINSFVDEKRLEMLDLSGNNDMKILPANLSKASMLQLLVLDGCDDSIPLDINLFVQPEATSSKEIMIESSDQTRYVVAAYDQYGDVFTKIGDWPTPIEAFPHAPAGQLDRHIEIGDGSCSVQSEVEANRYGANLANLMTKHIQSLYVHDVSTNSNIMPTEELSFYLRWCRVERCPNLLAVFPPGAYNYSGSMETIWVSDLRMARCVWSKGATGWDHRLFSGLQHLHLRRCPSLQFALAMGILSSFRSLVTLHIIHCGILRHVFVPGNVNHLHHPSVEFPKLTTIHLHDVPALREMCEAVVMVAPALKTIKIRGCWSLRRLPALKQGMRRKPTVEMEKDVWDALEWDGVEAGHHPSLYEAPVHSRHYRRRMLRITVLSLVAASDQYSFPKVCASVLDQFETAGAQ